MKQPTYKKILEHPDKDEIINKLIIGQSTSDINEWLKTKYSNISETKFIISESILKNFQSQYLDFYNEIQNDLMKTKNSLSTGDDLDLSVKNHPGYKQTMEKMANTELDIRTMTANLIYNIEHRLSQVFDEIQADPRNINTKIDRLLIDYMETFGGILEKYHKFTTIQADTVVQQNITLQVVDQHILVFHDVVKEVLAQMDTEASLYFMEKFNEKMSAIKLPSAEPKMSQEMKLAEAQVLNETINKKINE